ATPEYNYSLPGVLKNALDWASRPISETPLNDMPVGIFGASTGPWGTARAQLHLRQSCVYFNAHPLNKPVVQINHADRKFDADGKLTDEATRQQLHALLIALAAWTRRLRSH
ncbi:MAG: NAD(P)H-dependent oxidoreductase, partial [Chloroflexi bacterium]|nr:NAD(P)H-dependent oxidoreductase [Chloroflexota bacterium]